MAKTDLLFLAASIYTSSNLTGYSLTATGLSCYFLSKFFSHIEHLKFQLFYPHGTSLNFSRMSLISFAYFSSVDPFGHFFFFLGTHPDSVPPVPLCSPFLINGNVKSDWIKNLSPQLLNNHILTT